MKNPRSGFTLVEMLVTIVIIATVGTLSFACVRSARQKSKMIVEVNAARNLISGYLSYATENGGNVLPGFKEDSVTTNLKGQSVSGTIAARYPFRLAPSVPAIEGVLFFNGNENLLKRGDDDYGVSLRPNLGLNANFVGGFFKGSSLLDPSSPRIAAAYGQFYLSNLAQADDPSKLLVFSSARYRESGKNVEGYFQVQPPNMTTKIWSSAKFEEDGEPSQHGHVDFRWDGKAVTAMLGGNVELHTEADLRDMRHWSHQAIREDNPDYTVTRVSQ